MTKGMIMAALVLMSLPLTQRAAAAEEEGGAGPELRPVLLVVDVQNVWLPKMSEGDMESAPAKIREAIDLFRKSGDPIIVVYHTDPKRGPEPGTDAFACADWVPVTPEDPVVVKQHPSAFTHTELDAILKGSDRNAVFLCGLSAAGCVLATYFGALDRDYMAFMVEGALLSHDASYTDVIEDICYEVSIEDLATALKERH